MLEIISDKPKGQYQQELFIADTKRMFLSLVRSERYMNLALTARLIIAALTNEMIRQSRQIQLHS